MAMTHKERVLNTLDRKPVDRLAANDSLWGDTVRKYIAEGKLKEGEDLARHFDASWRTGGGLNNVADLDFVPVTLEETDETILKLDGNGAKLRRWKNKAGTPEHVGFTVEDRQGWDEKIKAHLTTLNRRRIPFDAYRKTKAFCQMDHRAFFWSGIAPFEQMHPVCGHENMLVGMALDPDWVKDMVNTFTDFTLRHLEVLFEEEGLPDAMWFFEDMGFKEKPFMSPAMYEDIVQPGHARLFEFAHSKGLKVMVHSCGFVEPLVPGLIDAGMDCLQAMEVKAGMDMPRLAKKFGDKITFCGNVDIRIIAGNDRKKIDEELQRKILPVYDAGSAYIVHSDHSIPPDVEHDTFQYFLEQGSRILQKG